MIKVLQAIVNAYYSVVYPVSQIDPVHRRWMELRRAHGIKARVRDW